MRFVSEVSLSSRSTFAVFLNLYPSAYPSALYKSSYQICRGTAVLADARFIVDEEVRVGGDGNLSSVFKGMKQDSLVASVASVDWVDAVDRIE